MSRLVARFWNEDGIEMPPLYRDPDHGLICTWNYLTLVAPWLDETTHPQDDPESDGGTGRDMATRARSPV